MCICILKNYFYKKEFEFRRKERDVRSNREYRKCE